MTSTAEACSGPSLTGAERSLRRNLALAARVLSANGHDDFNQGQVSARIEGRGEMWIKRAMVGFDEADPADMIAAPIDRAQTPPKDAPPELALHQAIYTARSDVGAIVHSHAPHTLVFGALGIDLKPLSHDGACFDGRLHRFDQTSQTILSHDVASAVATCLATGVAVLLENHGGLVVGQSLRQATVMAVVLERACQLQLMAEATPHPYRISKPVDVAGKQDFIYSGVSVKSYWEHQVRRIQRHCPEVQSWR